MSKKNSIRSFICDYRNVQFNKESYLESFIEKHSSIIFGEEISWGRSKVSNADLEGEDSDKNIVIVEVKKWKVNNRSNMNDQEHSSIGQIIRYARDNAMDHTLKTMRLFIVGDLFSRNVAKCCKYLRKQGFNIYHISVRGCIENLCEINIEKKVHTPKTLGKGNQEVYCYYYRAYRKIAELNHKEPVWIPYRKKSIWECRVGQTIKQDTPTRVKQQMGVPPEQPTIALIMKTDDSKKLEGMIHNILKFWDRRVPEAQGREWFLTSPDEVERIHDFLSYGYHS